MASPTEIMRVRLSAEGIQEILGAFRQVRSEAKKTGEAGRGATEALGSLGTVFAAQKIAAFAANALDAADGLYKMSQKTGVAVEELSVLSYMAQQAEVSNEDLGKSLVKLAKSFTALESGDKEAAAAFAKIGLNAQELKGLSLDQVLLKIATAQGRFADGASKAAAMTSIFGKSGANLIPLLNDMANGGFDRAREKAVSLGVVLSEDMAKAAQQFNDSMKELEQVGQATAVVLGQTVLPTMTKGIGLLTEALAKTPAGAKAFVGGTAVITAAATATAVAVRTLYAAFAGLGPIGLAVVALSALASGLIAIKAAEDAAQAAAVKENKELYARTTRGKDLVEQYRQETQALEKGGLGAKARKEHEEKLKRIKDDLIKLSPQFREALDKETAGYKAAREELERKLAKEQEELENKKKWLKAEIEANKSALKSMEETDARRAQSSGSTGMATMQNRAYGDAGGQGLAMGTARAKERIAVLEAQLKALEVETKAAAAGSGGGTPPDAAAAKAAAAERLAQAKRTHDAEAQMLRELQEETARAYKGGSLTIEEYYTKKRELADAAYASDLRLLYAQRDAAAAAPADDAAGRITRITRVRDLEAQIAALGAKYRAEAGADLEAEEQARAKVDQEHLAALRETEELQGQIGEATLESIAAEYDARIRAANDPRLKALLEKQRDLALGKAVSQGQERSLNQGRSRFDLAVDQVDTARAMGSLTEEQAVQKKIALYREYLPVLQAAATEQLRLANLTGNPEDLLAAQQNLAQVDLLKLKLKELGDAANWAGTTAKNAFQTGFQDLLTSLGDSTTSLTEKVLALGRALASALQEEAARRLSQSATEFLDGLGLFGGGGEDAGAAAASGEAQAAPLLSAALATETAGGTLVVGAGQLQGAAFALEGAGSSILTAAYALQSASAASNISSAGASLAAATGGHITGPGTGTSDSILARLSNGEFVQRYAAVQYYGLDFMHALNGLRIPKAILRGYAEGGPVGVAVPDRAPLKTETSLTGGLEIGLEPGLVARHIETPEGVRAQLRVLARNPKAARRALGL